MAGSPLSSNSGLAPFLIEPRFVGRVWGCTDLRPWFDRTVGSENGSGADSGNGTGEPIGEVWLTGDDCQVATGPYRSRRLAEVYSEASSAILGPGAPSQQSPLLIKVIFAKEKLSVQVHPDDRMALKYGEPWGKTECWYALAADPGAQVAVGLKPGATIEEVREGIEKDTLEKSLNVLPVIPGAMVFVDAGTVHAIWPGSILLETQQNSDVTYRMYDYGRPRELHIEKALEATHLETRAGLVAPRSLEDRTILIDAAYFRIERIPVEGRRASATLPGPGETQTGLSYLFAAAGSARLAGPAFEPVELPPRGIAAVPAASPAFTIEDLGQLDLIRISPHWPERAA